MRLAYADPPYPGQAARHYSHDPRCAEVDHVELLTRLVEYDGWALSTSSPALGHVLECIPNGATYRIAAWVKPFASFKPGVNPAYAWEPVIFSSARKRERTEDTARDWVACSITLKKGLAGAKPPAFCRWIFDLIGAQPGDTFDDLYPGTEIVTDCWSAFIGEPKQGPLL